MNEVVFESFSHVIDRLPSSVSDSRGSSSNRQPNEPLTSLGLNIIGKIGDNLSTQLNQIYNKALVVFRLSMHECYV